MGAGCPGSTTWTPSSTSLAWVCRPLIVAGVCKFAGVDPDELTETTAEREALVDDVFASLSRADQRGTGNLYLRGLMLDGRRKSKQPMGERLGVDYQQLQQFVSSSGMVSRARAPGPGMPGTAADRSGRVGGRRHRLQERRCVFAVCGGTHIPELWERSVTVRSASAPTSAFDDAATEVLAYSGCSPRPHQRHYLKAPSSLKDLVLTASRTSLRQVTWRHGTKATPKNKLASMTVRCPPGQAREPRPAPPRGWLPVEWLLAEWPTGTPAPTNYWLSTLPETTPLKELVRLATIRWRIEHDYRELKTGLGPTHFKGRTHSGWNHHMTLVTAAHLFITQLRTDPPTSSWSRLSHYGNLRELQRILAIHLGHCPHCQQHAPTQPSTTRRPIRAAATSPRSALGMRRCLPVYCSALSRVARSVRLTPCTPLL